MKISLERTIGVLIPMSLAIYNLNWKLGAGFGALAILTLITRGNHGVVQLNKSRFCRWWALYLFLFAVIMQISRSYELTISYVVGYLMICILLFIGISQNSMNVLRDTLATISIVEAAGVYIQLLLPSVYYKIMGVLVADVTLQSITTRVSEGYYTGFAREVSLTVIFLIVGVGLAAVRLFKNKESLTRKQKYKLIFRLIYLLVALLFTGKKAQPIFCLVALMITYLVYSNTKYKYLKIAFIAIATILIYIFALPMLSSIPSVSRYLSLLQNIQGGRDIAIVTSGRTEIYLTAFELWKSNKWFGIGWNNFKNAVPSTAWFSRFDVHNVYLQVLCETGYIGAIPYYLLIIISMVRILQAASRKKALSELFAFDIYYFFFFLFYSVTGTGLYEYSYYIIFFIALLWGEQEIHNILDFKHK